MQNMAFTGADGVMSAEGLLNDPTLFSGAIGGIPAQKDKLDVAIEYLAIVDEYPVPIKSVIFHTRRICSEYLEKYQLMVDLLECATSAEVTTVINTAISIRDECKRTGKEFVQDPKVYYFFCTM